MSYDPMAIANEFLAIANETGHKLTAMKLQKLVYYAHGWHLALMDGPLLNEAVEAWQWGPVVPSLYREFKGFGDKPITRFATDIRRTEAGEFELYPPRVDQSESRGKFTVALCRRIWDLYGKYTAAQLSHMTHAKDGPWYQAWDPMKSNPIFGTDIENSKIRDYFNGLREK